MVICTRSANGRHTYEACLTWRCRSFYSIAGVCYCNNEPTASTIRVAYRQTPAALIRVGTNHCLIARSGACQKRSGVKKSNSRYSARLPIRRMSAATCTKTKWHIVSLATWMTIHCLPSLTGMKCRLCAGMTWQS